MSKKSVIDDENPIEPIDDAQMGEPTDLEDQNDDAVQRQVDALTEALQRERADAMNLRRRHSEQLAQLKTTITADVITDLLPVIDNFERALKHVPEDLQNNDYVKGVQGVVRQFDKTLADLGVQKIRTVGEPFNPHLHDAVSAEEGDGEEIVSEELQAGYQLGSGGTAEVLRPAMVRVAASSSRKG